MDHSKSLNAAPESDSRYDLQTAIPFVACHLAVFGAIWTGITWQAAVVAFVLWRVRVFAVTAGYHRYFSHRTFKTSRVFQFILAFVAQTTAQKGVIWWAGHHRHHHKHSDEKIDIHSPVQDGFWHSHVGWIFAPENDDPRMQPTDLLKYPELRFLDRYYLLPPVMLALAVLAIWGWSGFIVGFFWSTVVTWHSTFTINSLCHVWGKRVFNTKDDSRNNFFLAVLTAGEGWHNNHHHYQSSTRNGFIWWQWDPTYYALVVLSWFGIVWDLRPVPERVLNQSGPILDVCANHE